MSPRQIPGLLALEQSAVRTPGCPWIVAFELYGGKAKKHRRERKYWYMSGTLHGFQEIDKRDEKVENGPSGKYLVWAPLSRLRSFILRAGVLFALILKSQICGKLLV
jgi:hypothetical protein